ncbi:amidohydrolase family protein [Phenylobacterium sp.]|uniref:amidohydrolase family protein n=1 Tax=Phenylobacterium sp. TaxID=1871053 RepID=UPI00272F1A9B|nr:amidohydrolase family protein [Phenylobacterium sp.]MDP1618073.1 amidohydrolase family protein [Phenylobacterium sp.]MDP1987300.1 amidohydrolase family protein [Phenylobacterium sp.]
MSVDISPDGQWLLFDLLGHVYRVSTAGGEAQALTQNSGVALNYHPRYAPDGRSIVFVSDRGGQANLWVMDADGARPRLILDAPDSAFAEPTWTADGSAVIAIRMLPHALGAWSRTNRIWSIPINGEAPRELAGADHNLVFAPSATADGRYVYFHQTSGPVTAEGYFKTPTDHQIRRLDLLTGRDEPVQESARRRYYHDEPFSDFAPSLSPDGRFMAFQRRVPGGVTEHDGVRLNQQTGLWLRDMETGEERLAIERLAPDQLETHTLYQIRLAPGYAWARDGASIVYSEGGQLRRAWLDDGRVETIPFTAQVRRTISEQVRPQIRLNDGPFEVRAPRWPAVSPDGQAFVFEAAGRLWRKAMDGTAAQPLLRPNPRFGGGLTVELSPAWSPDGRWIAFATWNDEIGGHLWKVRATGGAPVRLTTTAGEYLNPAWSADGRRLVAAKGAGGGLRGEGTGVGGWNDIIVLSAAGGVADAVIRVTTDGRFARPVFGADGRIYVASPTEAADPLGDARFAALLRSVAPDGGDPRIHAGLGAASGAVISPDGRHLAFEAGENIFLARLDPAAARLPVLAADDPRSSIQQITTRGGGFASWSADGRLAFLQGPDLKLVDPESGGEQTVATALQVPSNTPVGDLALINARILTMDQRQVIDRGVILVRNGRIVAVGADIPVEGAARVIDLQGRTVMPGLIDIHAHHVSGGDHEIIPPHRARSANYLAYGVTTLFDPAAPTFSVFALAEQTAAGRLIGPRVFSTGTPMYGHGGLLLSDRSFADDTAARLAGMGAIGLKQYYQPRRAQRQWATEAAREHGGLLVTGEGMDLGYNLGMIMDGQTAWEHPLLDLPLYDDVVQFVARSGTQYNPELITPGQGLYLIEYFMSEQDLTGDRKQQLWVPWKDLYRKTNFTRRPLAEYPAILSVQGVKDIVRAGGKVGVGGHGQDQGLGTHREIWTFALALDPIEALEAATIVNARYLGLEADLGSITAGKIADLIILEADPLADIRNSLSIVQVMAQGRLYDAETLDEVWPSPRQYGPRRWMMTR